jgi:PAS domain S-box-containing protein
LSHDRHLPAPEKEIPGLSTLDSPPLLINHLSLAVIAFDSDDRIVSWNSKAAELYGIAPEEAIGQRFSIFIPPEAIDDFHLAIQLVKRVGNWHGELRTVNTNYELLLVETDWQLVTEGELSPYIVAIHRDVTEQRAIRQYERRLAALTTALRLVTEIAQIPGLPTTLLTQCEAFLEQPPEPDRILYSGNGHTILLTVAESFRREWYRLLFNSYNYRVFTARDRIELLDQLQNHRDELHIAMVDFPDGSDLIVSEVWKVRPLLPVVVLDHKPALSQPTADHPVTSIHTPVNSRNLLQILALALSGQHDATNR